MGRVRGGWVLEGKKEEFFLCRRRKEKRESGGEGMKGEGSVQFSWVIYLEEIGVRPLRAVEEVLVTALLGFGGGGVGVGVGHLRAAPVLGRVEGVELGDEGGEGGGEEDVAFFFGCQLVGLAVGGRRGMGEERRGRGEGDLSYP